MLRVRFLNGLGIDRQRCEEDLAERGVPLPLCHRLVWATTLSRDPTMLVELRSPGDECLWAFAIRSRRKRALPGYRVLCVERFAPPSDPAIIQTALRALVDVARDRQRILSAELEVFSRDVELRDEITRWAAEAGFARRANATTYARTLAIDLGPAESDVFGSLHPTARRHVRAVEKNPTAIRCVEHPSFADRMECLMRETLSRTGGAYYPLDWAALIDLSVRHPMLVRLAGLFRTDGKGPESLLAFACGLAHGDHVEYAYAASTRRTDLRMPLGYAPAWDLIRWAKRLGKLWFDFGGITEGTRGDARDPLGGISDFKRYFSRNVVDVGEEWVFEPRRLPGSVARLITAAVTRVRA